MVPAEHGNEIGGHLHERLDPRRGVDVSLLEGLLGFVEDLHQRAFQNRQFRNGGEPDFTRGTLEGDIAPGEITFYRLQCDSDGVLRSYIAEGEVLPVATTSFGGIGVFAIHEMGRFYRHVLIQKRYPHHGAVAFGHYGKALFEVFKFLGVQDIAYNQPKTLPYPTENPWA
jgi:L-fucose isomerase-like protein